MSEQLIRAIRDLGSPRIGLVGDLMLDEYVWGDVRRISPEAPIPVLRVTRRQVRVGGAGSVAVNLARLGARVVVFSRLGADRAGQRVRELLAREGCDLTGVLDEPDRPTTLKTRLIGSVQQADRAMQQILRVDEEDASPASSPVVEGLLRHARDRAGDLDAILVSDYHKGLVSAPLVEGLTAQGRDRPILVDPALVEDYSLYRGVDLICPNRFEAQLASGMPCGTIEECRAAGDRLIATLGLGAVAMTLDREGILLCRRGQPSRHVPTRVRTVTDVTGAGDMVLTVLGLVTADGGDLDRAVELANVAAGIEVRHLGVTPVSRSEIEQELTHRGLPVAGKLKTAEELEPLLRDARESGRTVVFTNGCFDLLHLGHHHLLEAARAEGDLLVVAVNSDASIRRLKGPSRPRIPESDRVRMIAGLECVDYVTVFDDDTPIPLLERLRPGVLVKGAEYRGGGVVGHDLVEGYGGRIALVEQIPGISTTALLGEAPRGSTGAGSDGGGAGGEMGPP